jgi:poly(A) polymerase
MLEIMERTDLTESIFGDEMEVEAIRFWPNVRLMADVLPDEVVALALLIRAKSDSASQVAKLANHWKLSNKQVETLLRLSVAHTIDADADEAQQKKLLRQIGAENYRKLVLISWVEHLAHYQENTQLLAAAYRAMLALPDHWHVPEFPVTGEDIMALGIEAGPKVGEYLASLKDYWEADHYQPDKETLLQHLQDQQELNA